MIIKYTNNLGELKFSTDGNGDIRITDFEGGYLPPFTTKTVSYSSSDGQTTVSSCIKNRVITLSGDIKASLLPRFCRILSKSGTLLTGDKKIISDTAALTLGKRYGKLIRFVLQLTCNNPYFTDAENLIPVYYRTDIITNPFVLPTVFTAGNRSSEIENKSHLHAIPTITLYCTNEGENSGGITVSNETTGKKIQLLTNMLSGETIEIDISRRSVLSSKRGSMLTFLSDDGYIGDFTLCEGINLISVSTLNSGEEISCNIAPNTRYLECGIYG